MAKKKELIPEPVYGGKIGYGVGEAFVVMEK